MIRIWISNKNRDRIEREFLADARNAPTGLFHTLAKEEVRSLLDEACPALYRCLYHDDTEHTVNEAEVQRLLLADRSALQDYIWQSGIIRKRKKKLLSEAFRYENLSKRKVLNTILQLMDVPVCPYCNRQYTFTLASGKSRPQMDHYYPRDLYPYLAVSLYNLVPCCAVCNTAKGPLDTMKDPILYPYDEGFSYDMGFQIVAKDSDDWVKILHDGTGEFSLGVEKNRPIPPGKEAVVEKQMGALNLNEHYDMHKDYIRDILRRQAMYTPERIKDLYEQFDHLFRSREELKQVLSGTDTDERGWGKRTLSKLTYDIVKQLENGHIRIEKPGEEEGGAK